MSVLAAEHVQTANGTKDQKTAIVTMALPVEEIQRLILLKETGTFAVILRPFDKR